MGDRKIEFAYNEYYHVYNRGTDKRIIFQNDRDKKRFLELLYLSNSSDSINVRNIRRDFTKVFSYERKELLVGIGAYCLMPNHFHILLTPLVDDGVTKFMSKLSTAYSMYFNKKYDRSGRLFESTFKAQHVDEEKYLQYIYAYIHLNPVKLWQKSSPEQVTAKQDEVLEYLKSYYFSSLLDYLNISREEKDILSVELFPDYFTTEAEAIDSLKDWLAYKTELEQSQGTP